MGWDGRLPSWGDVAFAGSLAVLAVVELNLDYAFERTDRPGPLPLHFVVAAGSAALLAWRRTHPLLVAMAVAVLLGSAPLVVVLPNVYLAIVVQGIAVYSLAVYAPSWRSAVVPALVVLAFGILMGAHDPEDPFGSAATSVIFTGLLLMVGSVVRRSRARADTMQSERDVAAAEVRLVAAEERARIARELHDVVAHGMSVVALQAVGGRRMLESDPDQARSAFDTIERVTSDCLDEMRRLLGILRSSDDLPPFAPQPSLADLSALVDQARASGTSVEVDVDAAAHTAAPAVQLSAYRIAQEALTNVLKHAPGSATRLQVRREDSALVVEVVDDGPGPNGTARGHGLIGMRERVELFGGTLETGPESGGGFGVRARLPITRGAT